VETPDLRILLDAGVSLAMRSRTLPHPEEYKELQRTRMRIRDAAKVADYITISHYHFDHYTATWKDIDALWTWSSYDAAQEIYGDKVVLAKEYRNAINPSQRERGYIFGKMAKDFVKEIKYVDGKKIQVNDTTILFSDPVPHGEEGTQLGYVLITSILHGAPLYLSGFKVDPPSVRRGVRNLETLVREVPMTIPDHHLLRSMEGMETLDKLRRVAEESGNSLKTNAEYLNRENTLLEAERKRLYEENPPSKEFLKWSKMKESKRARTIPPY
jgi:predicted metallo-beta-lactamase superfamily hydrolase